MRSIGFWTPWRTRRLARRGPPRCCLPRGPGSGPPGRPPWTPSAASLCLDGIIGHPFRNHLKSLEMPVKTSANPFENVGIHWKSRPKKMTSAPKHAVFHVDPSVPHAHLRWPQAPPPPHRSRLYLSPPSLAEDLRPRFPHLTCQESRWIDIQNTTKVP